MKRFGLAFTYLAALSPLLLVGTLARANIPVVDTDRWHLFVGGFVEVDTINDSTRSFNEVVGNAPVSLNPQNGQSGRETFSIRNSRLAFTILAPEKDGWKSKGYLEFDLLGSTPSIGSPGGNTEAGTFNNPSLRLRHGYMQVEKGGWAFLGGQTWALLGWQPYYFIPSVQVAPVPAMLYSRTVQFRGVRSLDFGGETHAQAALGIMRPPERDSSLPSLEAGLRFTYDGWSSGFVAGATPSQGTQPLSLGISGTVRQFSVTQSPANPTGAMNHYTGSGLAIDTLIPIIPSKDQKDFGNSFAIGGEFTTGTGDGDQFSNWSGGLPTSVVGTGSTPYNSVDLDSGIGGFDSADDFMLVQLTTFNVYGQYHLPTDWRMWLSAGYGRLHSNNIVSFTGTTNPYNEEQILFGNVFKDISDDLRVAGEFAQISTTYTTSNLAIDNRVQLSAWYFF